MKEFFDDNPFLYLVANIIPLMALVWLLVDLVFKLVAGIQADHRAQEASDIGHLRFPDIAAYLRGRTAADERDELIAGVLALPHPDAMREARR